MNQESRHLRAVEIGALLWVIGFVLVRPAPFDVNWALAILAFAPLVIVPIALRLISEPIEQDWRSRLWQKIRFLQLPASVLFAGSLTLPKDWLATVLALPWLVTAAIIAVLGFDRVLQRGARSAECLGVGAGMAMLVIGAGWAVLDRAGIRPLEFKPVIVLLTAIHFHYAGFALPMLAGLAARGEDNRFAWWLVVAVVGSVPAVAVGITAVQLGLPVVIETAAAWTMSLAGLLVARTYWRLAHQQRWPQLARRLWRFASISLVAGMVLAAMYGSRHLTTVAWLDIPWMRAVHGTANAFGFSLVALLGWFLTKKQALSD